MLASSRNDLTFNVKSIQNKKYFKMKKIFLGILALTLMSGVAFATDGGGKRKPKKAKTECPKSCSDSKSCKKNGNCPDKPGCVCH